jgi:K+-sensing histidine kinase KdpD
MQHPLVVIGARYLLAVVTVAAALLITQSLQPTVFPTPLFFTAIVMSTWYGGTGPGLFATVLATGVLQYFFVSREHQGTAVVVMCLVTSLLAGLVMNALLKRHVSLQQREPADERMEVVV